MNSNYYKKYWGFTLIELLVVIAIIGIISTISFIFVNQAREKGKIAQAILNADAFKRAVQLYEAQMMFYPPDTNRGEDPGLIKKLPWNTETGSNVAVPSCAWCPLNWDTINIPRDWNGPYMSYWPVLTPWGGKYDYNYWPVQQTRSGCTFPAGVYIGVTSYSSGSTNGQISQYAEQQLVNQGLDADSCVNGEVQFLLFKL